jgi:hypothetical protein
MAVRMPTLAGRQRPACFTMPQNSWLNILPGKECFSAPGGAGLICFNCQHELATTQSSTLSLPDGLLVLLVFFYHHVPVLLVCLKHLTCGGHVICWALRHRVSSKCRQRWRDIAAHDSSRRATVLLCSKNRVRCVSWLPSGCHTVKVQQHIWPDILQVTKFG